MSEEERNQETISTLGENPDDLQFGVGVLDDKVIVKFDQLVMWFDMDPQLAIDFAESIITAAKKAADNTRIVVPRMPPGLVVN